MSDAAETVLDIPLDDVVLEGALAVPAGARGLVIFAHGSGSSRHSPRNNAVAEVLRERELGTFLFDLLTEEEDRVRESRFDIDRLTDRLGAVTDWLRDRDDVSDLSYGYFGSSTGAAAALRGAASRDDIGAVVSRGGRVDLAETALPQVDAATLFVVGGADTQVLELNRAAFEALDCAKAFHVVGDAGHLFEGPGELDEVATVAADWFADYLR